MIYGKRRWDGGPAAVLISFFILPALLFLSVWYSQYFAEMFRMPVFALLGIATLLLPAMLTWWQATRERRRRLLWTTLVLAGSALAFWLPANTLLREGPLPNRAYGVFPEAFAEATAVVFVAVVPLLMGALPAVLYALAVGQIRPVAGGTSPFAAAVIYVMGAVAWSACLLAALINPGAPPLMDQRPATALVLRADAPPDAEPDAVQRTWFTVLWRLRASTPPGGIPLSNEENQMTLGLARPANTTINKQLAQSQGVVQIVDLGTTRVQPGTELPSLEGLPENVDRPYRVIVTGNDLQWEPHWSGMRVGSVSLGSSPSDRPELRLAFDEEATETLREFVSANRENYMGVVLDGLVILSTPVMQPMEGDEFVLRGLNPGTAQLLASLLRYGPLPATVRMEREESPPAGPQETD